MPEAIDTEGNEIYRPADNQNAEDGGMPSITAELESLVSVAGEYVQNAAFFNVIVGPILIEAELALPLVGTNKQIMSFLNSYVPRLDGQINSLYGRVGLAIPAHLQASIPTEGATDTQQTSNQAQSNTTGLEQG